MSDEKPDYKVYRSRPRWLGGRKEQDGLSELRGTQPASAPPAPGRAADRPDYEVHRGGGGRRLPTMRRPQIGRGPRLKPGRLTFSSIRLPSTGTWVAATAPNPSPIRMPGCTTR